MRMERTVDVTLPCGLREASGRRARAARVTPLTGRAEAQAAADTNPYRAALGVLCASLSRLGNYQPPDIDRALLAGLYPIDRDYLLVQVARVTFGDVCYQTLVCPHAPCGKRVDLELDLRTLSAEAAEVVAVRRFVLPDGREGVVRIATAGDQAELHDLPESELEAHFLDRCLVTTEGCEVNDWRSIPAALRACIVQQSVEGAPALDLHLSLVCVECGNAFTYEYDPLRGLMREMLGARAALRHEVHCIASHYHWSEREILDLTRAQRRDYIDMIEADYPGAWSS
jgi:hypothetical protein